MAETLTSEQMKDLCVEKMGSELGTVFNALRNELAWLYVKWHQYRELFGSSSQRIDMLNRSAPLFFRIVQDSLWEDTLLHLSRLTDPAASGAGKTNLTVRALPRLIPNPQLAAEIGTLVNEARGRTTFAVDWRNRHIAHRDLRVALEEPLHELLPASRLDVGLALKALSAVLNGIERPYLGGNTEYDFGSEPGDAYSLLLAIRGGVEAEQERRERLSKGEPLEADLRGQRAI